MHSSSRNVPRLCDWCGLRQARFYPITVLGALCLAERAICEECDTKATAEANQHEPPTEDDFTILGPIQVDTLLESLPGAGEAEPPELLGCYADRIREIAQAHQQHIPDVVESYLVRFEAARDGPSTA